MARLEEELPSKVSRSDGTTDSQKLTLQEPERIELLHPTAARRLKCLYLSLSSTKPLNPPSLL